MIEQVNKTGVRLFEDFRDQLIIDRYDPLFNAMKVNKLNQLCSENSEDVLTWNVFRTLQQIDPEIWFFPLSDAAFASGPNPEEQSVQMKLWEKLDPPAAFAKEGPSEADILIETTNFVWMIECQYKSDRIIKNSHQSDRSKVIRSIDSGSIYAGERSFYYSLLILNHDSSRMGAEEVSIYSQKLMNLSDMFPHRSKQSLANVKGIGSLTWMDVLAVLQLAMEEAEYATERFLAEHAADWLKQKLHMEK